MTRTSTDDGLQMTSPSENGKAHLRIAHTKQTLCGREVRMHWHVWEEQPVPRANMCGRCVDAEYARAAGY